ncbi:hypothetical protein HOLleu_25760 [Holothuria leucospilota]|uniref:CCHC-type domain-containing protein n=1 Tax=Holothuria leucospilota TaxID=206669 RepID=A0A9Q1BTB7_HOLLE|nr:hypothetical protein HOLleu_25760 [Holothuria leucospilota]
MGPVQQLEGVEIGFFFDGVRTTERHREKSVTDYVLRAEKAATALNNAGENVSDSLVIAMILKGLPVEYKAFVVVVTQNEKEITFQDFKVMLRSYEETEKAQTSQQSDSIFKTMSDKQRQGANNPHQGVKCYSCGNFGHYARDCDTKGKTSSTGPTKRLGTLVGHKVPSCRPQRWPEKKR